MALFVPKDRKSLFRQFLAGMYDSVLITDPNGHLIEINPRAEEHFGYLQDEVLDKPISIMVPGLTTDIVQRIRKGISEDQRMLIDGRALCKNGDKFWCEVSVSVIDLVDPDDLVFTIRNVERRRKLRERLRAKENAFDISGAALFACDLDGHFTEANEAFREMFGLGSLEETREHVFTDFINDDPLPADFQKAVEGHSSVVGIVAQGDESDDQEIEVRIGPSKIGTKIVGVVGSIMKV